MMVFVFIILYILLIVFFLWSLKKYHVGFSLLNKTFGGILILREIILLIGLSSIFLNIYPIYYFEGFSNTQQSSVVPITFGVWLCLFIYILSLNLGSRITYRFFYIKKGSGQSLNGLLFYTLIILVLLYIYVSFSFGVKHAFFNSLFKGEDLLGLRLDNKYSTNMPSFFVSILNIYTYFSIILYGLLAIKSKIINITIIFIILTLLTYGGGKAPLFQGLLLYFLVSFSSKSNVIKFNISLILKTITLFIFILILMIFIIKVQFPDIDSDQLNVYLINRLGVGQIAGVYEQMNLNLHDPLYIYHSIPFANFFIEYPIFQKDLMMISENVLDSSSTGVKNSLFISEASSFGWLFLLISPFIVGFNTAISIAIIAISLSKFYFNDRVLSFKISTFIFLSMNSISGGFSDFLFFKSTILLFLVLSLLLIFSRVINYILLNKEGA